ncbi:transcriptional regulator [uncultured Clostridium sp.]|uniref:transcriptional regulator n=1 Tax=Lacrimispora sp. 38-1 TaxID=3125778 RepID=UPI0028D8A3A5|nr:transcriptional regulator [uncultured Clostridium sp.]
METITQTNRTILFSEINPEKLNLLTLIGDVRGKTSLDDDKIKEINEMLLVESFAEFLEKFAPVVYSWCDAKTGSIQYSLVKPENIPDNCITEIPLNEMNDLLNMLITLQGAKGAMGVANVDFKFSNVLDMISPKKIMEDIRQVRKEIQYTYGKYMELDDEDPKRLDMGDQLNFQFEQASHNYNNVLAMLPLAIEDIKTRLLLGSGESAQGGQEFKAGLLSMGDDGELKILEMKQEEGTQLAVVDDHINSSLVQTFRDDYDALNDTPSDYVRELVVRTFCPLTSTVESSVDRELEVRNYNTYLEFYKKSKDDFVKAVKPLIEKILGVKAFFDQYQVKEKGMQPKLLITNIPLEMLVKSSNLPRLLTYLNTTNDKNEFENTLWFGIVPDVELNQSGGGKLQRMRFAGNQKVKKPGTNSMESLATLMNAITPYKITTFFSFSTGEESTFSYVATEGIGIFKDKCTPLMKKEYSEFVVPCIPNVTIIPKDKSGLILDNRMVIDEEGNVALSQEKEDIMKMWIEGVYIGAAYGAAGIAASWQCPEYLKQRFPNTSMEYPGVRYDIEADDNALLVTTSMTKEISGFTNAIKNSINNTGFGFVFTSDNAQHKGRDIRNIMVYKARNLLSNGTEFEPIYKTLVVTYIERMLRFYSGDFKQDKILKFFSNNPSSQKSKWDANRQYVNSLLQDGDELDFNIDEKNGICNVQLTFSNTTRNLKVELTRKGQSA